METTERILVTPRSLSRDPDHPALARLRDAGFETVMPWPGRQPDEEELLEELPGCRGYLAGVETVSRRVLEAAKGLKAISRNGVGTDGIDGAAAADLGIPVLTTPGANAQGVAELAVGLLLALSRRLPFHDRVIKTGDWERNRGGELEGRTLALIGCGNIGRRVARAALALGMSVAAYDPYPAPDFTPEGFRWANSLEEALTGAGAVSLHCPPADRPIIRETSIDLVAPGAYLVNTARSALVDRDAVAAALDDGRLAGFATDVFPEEPPKPHPLYRRDDVIVTPHIGGFTTESVYRAAMGAAENLLSFLTEK